MFDFTSLKYKIAIIFLIPALGMLYFSSTYVNEKYNNLQNVEILTDIIYFTKASSKLIHELQKERGLSSGYLGEEYLNFKDALKEQRLLTDKAYSKFLSLLSANTITNDEVFTINIKISLAKLEHLSNYRIKVDKRNISFYEEIKYFSTTIDSLISSIPHITSKFSSISMSNSMNALFNLISMKEYAGIERAFLSNIFSKDTVSTKQFNNSTKYPL